MLTLLLLDELTHLFLSLYSLIHLLLRGSLHHISLSLLLTTPLYLNPVEVLVHAVLVRLLLDLLPLSELIEEDLILHRRTVLLCAFFLLPLQQISIHVHFQLVQLLSFGRRLLLLGQTNGLGLRNHRFLLGPLPRNVPTPLDLAPRPKASAAVAGTGIRPAVMVDTVPAVGLALDLLGGFLIVLAQTRLEPKLDVDVFGVDLL